MTAPLTPPGCDLRDFPHTPLFRSRLFGSTFHARATDAEWRAGVTLWLKSWDQVPAGSLPMDDIDLCRLAELARDMKTWRKVKDGALRGWVECDDGRFYHPVVAEGINNAIEHKVKQRLKTAKARIAALEKHLKEAKTDDDIARITDEIERIRQTVSQSLSQTLSQAPREGEGEERGKEKGLGSSEAKASGTAGAAPAVDKSGNPVETERQRLWRQGRELLVLRGLDDRDAGLFIGRLAKDFPGIVQEAVDAAVKAEPADPQSYLVRTCQRIAAERNQAVTVPGETTEAYLVRIAMETAAEASRKLATPAEIAAIKAQRAGAPA